jgi:hypothetical protein
LTIFPLTAFYLFPLHPIKRHLKLPVKWYGKESPPLRLEIDSAANGGALYNVLRRFALTPSNFFVMSD